ncbi:MAG: glutaredoxin 3 [Halioglobus sp.]|nr:glutaredoxin 3 [Halioglobus sp.]
MTAAVTLYTTRFCPYCIRAKQLLESKGVAYDDIPVDHEPALRQEMMQRSGRRTVPQIWIGEQHIGGCDELYALEQQGRLDDLLARPAS